MMKFLIKFMGVFTLANSAYISAGVEFFSDKCFKLSANKTWVIPNQQMPHALQSRILLKVLLKVL